MARRLPNHSALRSSLHRALVMLAGTRLIIGGGEIVYFVIDHAGPVGLYAAITLTGFVYIATGLIAWARRPGNRTGAIMVPAGLCWFLSAAGNLTAPAPAMVGTIFATSPVTFIVWLLHVFPSGRTRTRLSQLTVVCGFVVALVLQAPLYLFQVPSSYAGALLIADRPDLAALGGTVQSVAGLAVMLVTTWVLAGRIRRAPARQRWVLVPLYAYGIIAVLAVPVGANVIAPLLALTSEGLVILQLGLLAGVPVAFTSHIYDALDLSESDDEHRRVVAALLTTGAMTSTRATSARSPATRLVPTASTATTTTARSRLGSTVWCHSNAHAARVDRLSTIGGTAVALARGGRLPAKHRAPEAAHHARVHVRPLRQRPGLGVPELWLGAHRG